MKCPFKDNKVCSHKKGLLDRRERKYFKRVCGFKDHNNCPLFLEWYKYNHNFRVDENNINKLKKINFNYGK